MLSFKHDHLGTRHSSRSEEIPLTRMRTQDTDTTDDDSSPRHTSLTSAESNRRNKWRNSQDGAGGKRNSSGLLRQRQDIIAQLMSAGISLTDQRTPANHTDGKKPPQGSRGSLFTNFEDVQLNDEERLYLSAAALGDVPIIRQSLEEAESSNMNVNCVDYMGRSALHLAVDSENMEAIELLLDKLNFESTEEALLHAISKGATKIVKVIIEHPNYMAEEDQVRRIHARDPFFRTEEKSQFSPDITPLILAAHYNNHEIIQMFLSRNHTIDRPHPISCQCSDCVSKQNYDSLKRSRSRLNAYRALASPAYMALSSPDPIMSTFELRQEMKKLAQDEKEFKNEYLGLVEQCMNFACELMDLCRGTQEVEAVLCEGGDGSDTKSRDPLARLKMALEYEEKKFVAHPNCQQHLTSIWYGPEMGFMQSLTLWKKLIVWFMCVPLMGVLCLIYILYPGSKVGRALRCPSAKFILHTLSHICFLFLLAAATFRLDDETHPIESTTDVNCTEQTYVKAIFRPANTLMTHVQMTLTFWILGMLWMELKQIYNAGVRVYLLDYYNMIDFTVLSLYLASYVLRFLVDQRLREVDATYNATARAREALATCNITYLHQLRNDVSQLRADYPHKSYFLTASRFEWAMDDPEIVSDMLFAVANVMSIARTTYLMPAFEVLGPLQISLGRMLGDITRFLALFTLVLVAFMVGLHNLYWYYGSQTYKTRTAEGGGLDKFGHSSDGGATDKLVHSSEAFQGLPRTLYSLFWSMFGLVDVGSVEIKYPGKNLGNMYMYTFPGSNHAASVVESVGLVLFAVYNVVINIVLINMLIAMMSHSFEQIQGDCDVEWKFARTRLWMNYIDEGSTLPVPFNMIPSPKSFKYVYVWLKEVLVGDTSRAEEKAKRQTFIKRRREMVCQKLHIEAPETSYTDILQRLVRRYLFKLERLKDESKSKDTIGMGLDNSAPTELQRVSSDDKETAFVDMDDDAVPDIRSPSNSSTTLDVPRSAGLALRRRPSLRPSGGGPKPVTRSRRPSITATGSAVGGAGGGAAHVQLLSMPQLDAMQRTLRLLDVRMQHVQSSARHDEKTRDDVDHIRRVMSENQKALSTVVTVLSAIQEEVRMLSISMHKQQQQRLEITVPRKRSGELRTSSTADQRVDRVVTLREQRDSRDRIFESENSESSRL